MNSDYTRIRNYELVTSSLGGWPSFDDFEIVSMLFERSHDGEESLPVLTVQFFGFRPDVSPDSPDRNNCLLTIRFEGVENVKLDGFNHQNAINGFIVVCKWSELLKREVLDVKIVQGFGVGATFESDEIEVVSVKPAVPHKP